MAVRIGSARIDERGKATGGKAGDQTGVEVSTQDWYLHSKGWYVLRAKTAEQREKIARDMEYACENYHIGYDQSQNRTLYDAVKPLDFDCSKVVKDVETDCAQLVRVCVLYAGISCSDFYTATEVDALYKTGAFWLYKDAKYCASPDYLMRGDILCTRSQGHTVVVLTNGKYADADAPRTYTNAQLPILEKGMTGDDVKALQTLLVLRGYSVGPDGVDGDLGSNTLKALKKFQTENGMNADGVAGRKTWGALVG